MSMTVADVLVAQNDSIAAGQPFEVDERQFAGQTHRAFVHAPATLVDVLASLRAHGEADFVVFDGRRWTYAEFFADADALAATLQHELSVRPGDRVAIAMRNCCDWLITLAAAVQVGAIVVPVNSWGSADELEFTLRNSGATVLAADLPRAKLAYATGLSSGISLLFSDVDGEVDQLPARGASGRAVVPIADAVAAGRGRDYVAAQPTPEETALLLYTSGSTGHPKGVTTRHVAIGQILMNMMLSGIVAAQLAPSSGASEATGEGGAIPLPVPQAHLITVPLFHATGLLGGFLLPGLLGHKVALLRKWDAEVAMSIIQDEKITMLASVPAIFKDLLTHPRFDDYDCSSVTRTSFAGAATPADLPDLMRAKLGVVGRGAGYGMTESGAVGSTMSGPVYDLKPLSAGVLSPIIEMRTVGADGIPLPPGREGEIQLRGITVTPGYWGLDDQTREAFTDDGWLRTGDIGLLDEDGFMTITGRIKEIVIRGGENIAPVEIENVAYRHADAKEVAVFGVPDDAMGEELAMVCHRQPGSTLSEEELRSHLRTMLPGFKVPRYIVVTDTPLPRNSSEKIHRLAVRDSFIAG
jgi:long-chain acyl-CoA synthetase